MIRVEHRSLATGGRDDWRTPATLLARVARVGPIAVDPCAADDPLYHFAAVNFTADADGLAQSWLSPGSGVAFANPPYSDCAAWIAKGAYEAALGASVLILVPARPGSRWYRNARSHADAIAELHGRLTFVGAATGAPFPSVVIAMGVSWRRFARAFGDIADIQIPSVAALPPAVPVAPRNAAPAPTGRGSGKSKHSASGGRS